MSLRPHGNLLMKSIFRGFCSCCRPILSLPRTNVRSLGSLHNAGLICGPAAPKRFQTKNSIGRYFGTVGGDQKNKEESTQSKDEQSLKGKLKILWKNYGIIAVGTYLGVYVGTLGSVFLALDFDIFNAATFGMDPNNAVHKLCDLFHMFTGNDFLVEYIKENPRVATFAVAWVMTKFTEPVRLGVTIGIVPKIARWFGKHSPIKET